MAPQESSERIPVSPDAPAPDAAAGPVHDAGDDHPAHIDVCVIDDDDSIRALLARRLRNSGYRVDVASDGEQGFEVIKRARPKVVLSDWMMPHLSGLELCDTVRKDPETAGTYFILLTAQGNITQKTLALESGVDDYLTKPCDPRELLARIRVGLRVWALQEELREAAIIDGLTGLYNHQYFIRLFESEFRRHRRYGTLLSVLMIDIDRFKSINDIYGHEAGNAVLAKIASLLKRSVRDVDILARYGGEEFTLVAPECRLQDGRQLGERLRAVIEQEARCPEVGGKAITVSVGVSSTEVCHATRPEDLIEAADSAMYLSKRAGRNRVHTCLDVAATADPCAEMEQSEVSPVHTRMSELARRSGEHLVDSIFSLVQAYESRHPLTKGHSDNVAFYAERIARELGLSDAELGWIVNAAKLHDIGKVGVPDAVLFKTSGLTPSERAAVRNIPQLSASILGTMRVLGPELDAVRYQREFYDGSGYPDGLAGDRIPLASRILLAADAFDALTAPRSYRESRSIEDAITELEVCAGTQFDPVVVQALRHDFEANGSLWREFVAEVLRRCAWRAEPVAQR